jgi:hypothetical protein
MLHFFLFFANNLKYIKDIVLINFTIYWFTDFYNHVFTLCLFMQSVCKRGFVRSARKFLQEAIRELVKWPKFLTQRTAELR